MAHGRTLQGWELRLRPRGAERFVSAAFLAFWLCFWVVGESLVLWLLIRGGWALLTGTPPDPGRERLEWGPGVMVGLFLLVWLALWTLGGIAAISELLRLLWGEDRITYASGRLEVVWVRGIFRRVRSFERNAIRRISLVGRRDHLSLETAGAKVELSGLGTRAERMAGAEALRTELRLEAAPQGADDTSAPPRDVAARVGWELILGTEGERVLAPSVSVRRSQARFAGIVTVLFAAVTLVVVHQSARRLDLLVPAFILFAFTAGLAAGTLWLARGRWEWRLGHGRLTLRKRFGDRVRDVFEARRLMFDRTSDSDGDPWFELIAVPEPPPGPPPVRSKWRPYSSPPGSRVVVRRMDDESEVRDLAVWLARETGLPLEDRTTPEVRAAEFVEMRAMLEQSGRFGRWAARFLDKIEQRGKDRSP